MVNMSAHGLVSLDSAIEREVRSLLIEHFSTLYQDRMDGYVDLLLDIDHFTAQFEYLRSIVDNEIFGSHSSILISGFSVGSEMVAARQAGYGKIYGVEVDSFLNNICQKRLGCLFDMYPSFYDGEILPFDDNPFCLVSSSHVIEHTRDPALYLGDCMRVLIPGGYLFLEFPHRHHRIELHTQLPSYEWLPRPIRNAILRFLTS